ncbi:uncharacterized protein LOC123312009 [Coccinella septempunctata]|uniref:uncharacterized protein LOC123312009 n=1 Tax=Coccinella septempunctata TaxID=41139 RepID=UPI001D089CFB|nr:uncharacterized protein LOC123312009 [Coccinella septempunctata]
MVSFLDEILLCLSYLAVAFISLNCLNIYVSFVGTEARSFAYGLFIINGIYGIGGAISAVTSGLDHVQVIFYAAEISLVLPFLTTEMWIQKNLFPKQQELVYVPCLLGVLPFFSFIMLGVIRIDLVELCLVYCCVCTAYVGYSTRDYLVVAGSLLFYLAYCMHFRGKVKISNVLLIFFTLCSLGSICPNCVDETRKKSDFPFKELGF